MSELDNPIWWSLTGRQRHLGIATQLAARFDPAVSPFGAMADDPTHAHWEDLATIAGPGGQLALITASEGAVEPGPGWTVVWQLPGLQMLAHPADHIDPVDQVEPGRRPPPAARGTRTLAQDEPSSLGTDDVADMLALVADSRPGPFFPRTVEFGGYVGIRREGRLIAMAGQRLRPPGYVEVSAVATDPAYRRQGLAGLLVTAVVDAIVEPGETPFLHVAATNADAIRLYESMGFIERRRLGFALVQAPGAPRR